MSPDTCPECKEGDTITVTLGPVTTVGDSMVCAVSSASKGESSEEETPEEDMGETGEMPEESKTNPMIAAVVGRGKK